MSSSIETINIVELTTPTERDPYGVEAARLVLKELTHVPEPTDHQLHRQMEGMDHRNVYAALSSEGTLLGTAALMFFLLETGPVAIAADIVTDSTKRRQGTGSRLLGHIEDEVRAMGLRELRLFPEPDYLDFYTKRGYEQEPLREFASKPFYLKVL